MLENQEYRSSGVELQGRTPDCADKSGPGDLHPGARTFQAFAAQDASAREAGAEVKQAKDASDAPAPPPKTTSERCRDHAAQHLKDNKSFQDYTFKHPNESKVLLALQDALISGNINQANCQAKELFNLISNSLKGSAAAGPTAADLMQESVSYIQNNLGEYDPVIRLGMDVTDQNTLLVYDTNADKEHALEINRAQPRLRPIEIRDNGFVTVGYEEIVHPTAGFFLKDTMARDLIDNIYYSKLTGFSKNN